MKTFFYSIIVVVSSFISSNIYSQNIFLGTWEYQEGNEIFRVHLSLNPEDSNHIIGHYEKVQVNNGIETYIYSSNKEEFIGNNKGWLPYVITSRSGDNTKIYGTINDNTVDENLKTMKTLYIIFFISTSIFAQSPIIDIEEYTYKSEIENAYYKDINNYFNDFEGTWLYTNGNTSLKIVLTKETMQYTGKFYTDGITGEYQYIENGLEKRNTLSNTNQYLKGIWSAFLMKNEFHPICENCQPNERRLNISFSDRTRGLHGTFIFKKTIINGQIALVGHLLSDGPGHYDEANPPQYFEMAVPSGNYTFIKQ